MKTATTLLLASTLNLVFSISLHAQSKTNLIINTGKPTMYDLKAKDSLVITEGVFTGSINSFDKGAKITVVLNAGFEPAAFNNPKGELIVYGSAKMKDLNTNEGFRLDNYGVTTITGAVNMNGGEQYFYNYFNATLSFKGDVNMNKSSFLQNDGTITSLANFTMNSGSSFLNKNSLSVSGNMTVNNGILNNQGKALSAGLMTFNNNANVTNVCRMISDGGLTNNSDAVYNSGLIWVSSKKADNTLTNNGTISGLSDATIKTAGLTNYGNLTGNTKIYATGTTINTGTLGNKDRTTDSIKIFDVSRTSDKTILDQQYGKVNNNVVFASLSAPDTINALKTCSSTYLSLASGIVILPIKWNYFTVRLVNGLPVINWSADHDPGTVYQVERSYDQNAFTGIATIPAADNQTIFSFNDKEADPAKTVIYYRIKGIEPSGEQKFTEIKAIHFAAVATGLQVSPNPFSGSFTISFKSEKKQILTVSLYNANGQWQAGFSLTASAGSNNLVVSQAASFSRGVYIVTVSRDGHVISTQKLIKQ